MLQLCAGNLYGGIETQLLTLARDPNIKPAIMERHFAPCFEGRLSQELRAVGASVRMLRPVRLSRPWTVWRARQALRTVLAAEHYDLAICHECWVHTLFAPVIRQRRLPLVFWSHDIHQGRNILERLAAWTRPDLVIANSQATRQSVDRLFPNVPVEVVYPPVMPPTVDRERSRQEVRAELQTAPDTVVIIQTCRFEPWKGHGQLLQALSRLTKITNWVCWIAGGAQRPAEQKYVATLKEMEARLGLAERVRWLGQRNDVPALLAAADIHCQPNTGPEPFGIAFIEALYAGLPVVTTAIGAALEIVDETCGILTPPGDAVKLADALASLIEGRELRVRLGRGGPMRASELSDWRRQLNRLSGLLRGLISRMAP